MLPRILSSAGQLPAKHARNGERVLPNRIYVARPDHHLPLHDAFMRVVRGPREDGHRPAIDPLFRTAAYTYGPRVIGIVLSGALDDGTAGLFAIKSQGGLAMVQDPNEAVVDAMPRNALENVDVDHVLPGSLAPTAAAFSTRCTTATCSATDAASATRSRRRPSTCNSAPRSKRRSGRRFAPWRSRLRSPGGWPSVRATSDNPSLLPVTTIAPTRPSRRRGSSATHCGSARVRSRTLTSSIDALEREREDETRARAAAVHRADAAADALHRAGGEP